MSARAIRIAVIALAASVVPRVAGACSVCFMGVESRLLDSARMGVLAMAVVLVGVLAAFARWFRRLAALEAGANAAGRTTTRGDAATQNGEDLAMRPSP